MSDVEIWALLIGINHYPARDRFGRTLAPPLQGCARDVEGMARFLEHRLEVPRKQLRSLIVDAEGMGDASSLPTRSRVLEAVEELERNVPAGGQILLHFSGHGAQVPTLLPAEKGERAKDECLALYDLDERCNGLLRDIELAALLRRLASGGRRVFAVLDCCHSGGAMRTGYRLSSCRRGIDLNSSPAAASPAATTRAAAELAELARGWTPPRALDPFAHRRIRVSHFRDALAPGVVVLSACRPWEAALEAPRAHDGAIGGVLSQALLEVLADGGDGQGYADLFTRLVARVHGRYQRQVPMLEGDESLLVLGREHLRSRPLVTTLSGEQEEGDGEIVLAVGEVHGARLGARLRIFGQNGTDSREPHAVAELVEVSATASRARLVETSARVVAGDRAELFDLGELAPRFRVAVLELSENGTLRSGGASQPVPWNRVEAGSAVRKLIAATAASHLEEATTPEDADFLLSAEFRADVRRWCLEVTDCSGASLTTGCAPLPVEDPRSLPRTVARLIHLAKFRRIWLLANRDSSNPLAGHLRLELFRKGPLGGDLSVEREGGMSVVLAGRPIWIDIINESSQDLTAVLLNLEPTGEVTQIHPPPSVACSFALRAESRERVELRCELPPGRDEGIELLKLIAAKGPVEYRYLQLPPLDGCSATFRHGAPQRELDRLLCSLVSAEAATRSYRLPATGASEWTTYDEEVRVLASGTSS